MGVMLQICNTRIMFVRELCKAMEICKHPHFKVLTSIIYNKKIIKIISSSIRIWEQRSKAPKQKTGISNV